MARCSEWGCHSNPPYIDWDEDGVGPAVWDTCACGCGNECHPITEEQVGEFEDNNVPDEREWNDDHTGPPERD